MTNTRSAGLDQLRSALSLTSAGLISLLFWQVAAAIFGQSNHCVVFALAPLLVASFRHPFLGRLLAWSGALAQVALMLRLF